MIVKTVCGHIEVINEVVRMLISITTADRRESTHEGRCGIPSLCLNDTSNCRYPLRIYKSPK